MNIDGITREELINGMTREELIDGICEITGDSNSFYNDWTTEELQELMICIAEV